MEATLKGNDPETLAGTPGTPLPGFTPCYNGMDRCAINEYCWIWMEVLRLNGAIYKGVIWLEQQIEIAAEVMYN